MKFIKSLSDRTSHRIPRQVRSCASHNSARRLFHPSQPFARPYVIYFTTIRDSALFSAKTTATTTNRDDDDVDEVSSYPNDVGVKEDASFAAGLTLHPGSKRVKWLATIVKAFR